MTIAYPAHRAVDVALRDGSTVRVRPVLPDDAQAMLELLEGLSVESRMFRFFSAGASLEPIASWAIDVDYRERYGIVATTGTNGATERVVGHAAYVATGPGSAEVAFEIANSHQDRGLGTIFLAHLAEAAQEAGIETFEATVLPGNRQMVDVFRESGFPVTLRSEPGEIHVEAPTSLTENGLERFASRDQIASAAALHGFLSPKSVAVIGASRERGTVGGELLHNLLAAEFSGVVYPVNPQALAVQSVRAYPSIAAVPDQVDLAVIAVAAPLVADVARACASAGVPRLLVISAGFAEIGEPGLTRQRELLEVCRDTGVRLIGPNCLGIVNTDPGVRLNATFARGGPPRGRVGFLSQSGALGLAIIDRANELGLGVSSFVSVGNKSDISGNDVIQYWEKDDATDLILLYLESFGNPRKFSRIARRVGRQKPIIAVKSGRSAAGARASSSHTGAIVGASDVTVDALFRQAGVIRVDTLAELWDVATLLDGQPPPAGPRVGIITNAGGPGILCADACEAHGLEVPRLSRELQDCVRAHLPVEASVVNPIDMIATATAEQFEHSVAAVAASGEVDALIAIFIPPLRTRTAEVAAAVRRAAHASPAGIPVLAVLMSGEEAGEPGPDEPRLPVYTYPEDAAHALARVARYGAWRREPEGAPVTFDDVDIDGAAATIAAALAPEPRWLEPASVATLLAAYAIPLVASRDVGSAAAAGRAAAELGGPVALKAVGPTLLHKSDLGAVELGLVGKSAVTRSARAMAARLSQAGHETAGFTVQQMAPRGTELLVGVVQDRMFGPVLACGAGGVTVELIRDIAVRLTPLTDRDAASMLRSLRTFPLLTGYRGASPADISAIEHLLLRVSAMVENHPEIAELDLNPVMATPDGVTIVDARVRIEIAPPPRPTPSVG